MKLLFFIWLISGVLMGIGILIIILKENDIKRNPKISK